MFVKLSHPMIYVNDLGRAVDFYTTRLGFEIKFHHPGAFASLYHPKMDCRLDLHPSEANSKDVGFGAIIYFTTSDLDRDVTALKEKSVKVGTPKTEGGSTRFVTFWDSEGNALGLEQMRG